MVPLPLMFGAFCGLGDLPACAFCPSLAFRPTPFALRLRNGSLHFLRAMISYPILSRMLRSL